MSHSCLSFCVTWHASTFAMFRTFFPITRVCHRCAKEVQSCSQNNEQIGDLWRYALTASELLQQIAGMDFANCNLWLSYPRYPIQEELTFHGSKKIHMRLIGRLELCTG